MKDDPEFEVVYSDLVKQQMESDPDLAAAIREFSAMARQVAHGIETGQYESFDEGMEALTGNKPKPIDLDDIEDE